MIPNAPLLIVIRWEIAGMAIVYKEFDKRKIKIASDFHELILFLSSILEISIYLSLKW